MINSDVLAEFKEENDQQRIRNECEDKVKSEKEVWELKKNTAINLFLAGISQLD